MGLFTSRPEEPTEWAGLPSEPLRPRSAAEQLDAEVPDTDLLAGTGIASISIPMPVVDVEADADGE